MWGQACAITTDLKCLFICSWLIAKEVYTNVRKSVKTWWYEQVGGERSLDFILISLVSLLIFILLSSLPITSFSSLHICPSDTTSTMFIISEPCAILICYCVHNINFWECSYPHLVILEYYTVGFSIFIIQLYYMCKLSGMWLSNHGCIRNLLCGVLCSPFGNIMIWPWLNRLPIFGDCLCSSQVLWSLVE